MPPRAMPYRIGWPLNASSAQAIDSMFEMLFDDIRNGALIINAVQVIGVLGVPSGGLGAGSYTANGVLYGNGVNPILVTAQGGANSILTANAGAPSFSSAPTIGTSITTPQLNLGIGAYGAIYPEFGTLFLRTVDGAGYQPGLRFQDLTHAAKIIGWSYVTNGTTAGTRLAFVDSSGSEIVIFSEAGQMGIGLAPTAHLTLKAGAAGAGQAPFKFTSGTNLTTGEAGAFEYNGTTLFFTRTGTARQSVLVSNATSFATSTLLGRGSAAGAGDPVEITLGSGLSMTGTTLSAGAASGFPDATYLTEVDETADLPNSRMVLAGTNITFDDTVPNERTINASGGGSGLNQLTGDVTAGPGTGSQVATIAAAAVTYAKIQDISAASKLLGRGSAGGAGDTEEITLGTGLVMSGTTLNGTAAAITQITGDVTAGPGSGSQAATIPAGTVTYAKMQDVSAISKLLGRGSAAGAGDVEELTLGTNLSMSGTTLNASGGGSGLDQLTGDVTAGPGSGSQAATIPNGTITYAKMQDVSATSRVLGRKTAGAGDAEELTFSEVLDFVGSAAQGDLLYRNATAWVRLGAGTSGQFLKTLGTGANPTWAAAPLAGQWGLIASHTPTADASKDFTGLSAYGDIRVILLGITLSSSGIVTLRVSEDNGSTFLAATTDYTSVAGNGSPGGGSTTTAVAFYGGNATTARYGMVTIEGFNLTAPKGVRSNFFSIDGDNLKILPGVNALNAIRILPTAGNMTGGTIYVYGR